MKKFNMFDLQWSIGLFGTAVGAGILFLPLRAGVGGIIPIFIMAVIMFPLIFLSHRYLANFVVNANNSKNIAQSATQSFGKFGGMIFSILYFFAIYPICLAYGVGITNTVDSFLQNQLQYHLIPRWLLAIILISLMMLVMTKGKNLMLKITNIITYPLIFLLFACSIYLIPQWHDISLEMPSFGELANVIWISLPILVFAFNHSPAISYFAYENKMKYKEDANYKISQTLFITTLLLTIFIMFFVLSAVMALTSEDLIRAKQANIPILSYFANMNNVNLIFKYVAPMVAFFAITSSFFGHYLGAFDGMHNILSARFKNHKALSSFIGLFMYMSMIVVAIYNPSILGFIEDLGSPILVILLFILPIYVIYKVSFMKEYKNRYIRNTMLLAVGLLTLLAVILKLI